MEDRRNFEIETNVSEDEVLSIGRKINNVMLGVSLALALSGCAISCTKEEILPTPQENTKPSENDKPNTKPENNEKPNTKPEENVEKPTRTPAQINEQYGDADIIQQLAMWQGEKMLTVCELGDFSPRSVIGAEDLAFGEVIQVMTSLGKRELSAMTMQYIEAGYPFDLQSDHPRAFLLAGGFTEDWVKASKEDRRTYCNYAVDLLHRNGSDIYDKDPFTEFTKFLDGNRQADGFLTYSKQRLQRDLDFFHAQQQKSMEQRGR